MTKKLKIKLNEWHYTCGDGCCDKYGVELFLNGKKCGGNYAGEDVEKALTAVLKELGHEFEIEKTYYE